MENTHAAPIVVGYDGSPDADLALQWAAEEAAHGEHPLEIVYALEWLPEFAEAISDSTHVRLREHARRMVEQARGQLLSAQPGLTVSARVEMGHPAAVLCDLSSQCRMVVLGSRGRGGFIRVFAGSVSMAVATHAHCPVVVVRRIPQATARLPIVVAVDDAGGDRSAIEAAFAEAEVRRAPLIALHAWQPPALGPYTDSIPRAEEIEQIEESERRLLDQSIAVPRRSHPAVRAGTRLVKGGPATALAEASYEAQLLVIGARSHGGFGGLLLGSVSTHLLHTAACPVMIHREVKSGTGPSPQPR